MDGASGTSRVARRRITEAAPSMEVDIDARENGITPLETVSNLEHQVMNPNGRPEAFEIGDVSLSQQQIQERSQVLQERRPNGVVRTAFEWSRVISYLSGNNELQHIQNTTSQLLTERSNERIETG